MEEAAGAHESTATGALESQCSGATTQTFNQVKEHRYNETGVIQWLLAASEFDLFSRLRYILLILSKV